MYEILLKMKKIYNHANWLKMAEQARERGKITDEEYRKLTDDENSDNQ